MNLPITSRVKRSPLLQTKNEIATGSQVTPGEDVTTTVKGKEKTKTGDFDKNWDEAKYGPYDEWIKKPENKAKEDKFIESKQEGTGEFDPDETVITKGEDKVVDVDLKRKQYQDVMEGPWEQRRILRQGRMVGRQKNRYKRKLEKYGTFDADGKFTQKDGLSQKQQRKSMQFQEGLTRTESARQRTDEGIASGKRPGSRIKRKEDRDATTGEFDDKQQTEMGARKQQKRDEMIAASGMTTDQATGAVNASANPFSQALDSAKAIGEEGLNYKSGGYTPFKMKGKSPAKLGPLAAIAAKAIIGKVAGKLMSPGKMKSSFKMKGYGKK